MTLERIEQSRLTDLTIKALQTYGLSEPDARSTAEILVLADMFGLHTHGVSRVESYGERLELGGIKASAQMKVEKCAPAISTVDGDNGIGPLVGQTALKEAIELAGQTGVGESGRASCRERGCSVRVDLGGRRVIK